MEKRFLLQRLSRRKTRMRGGLRVCNLWSSNGFLSNAFAFQTEKKRRNPCYVLGVVYLVPLVCKMILKVSRFFALWLWPHIYYSLISFFHCCYTLQLSKRGWLVNQITLTYLVVNNCQTAVIYRVTTLIKSTWCSHRAMTTALICNRSIVSGPEGYDSLLIIIFFSSSFPVIMYASHANQINEQPPFTLVFREKKFNFLLSE